MVAEITQDGRVGRGECVPYGRYGETVAGILQQVEQLADDVNRGLDRADLQRRLPPGAARNAVDCALWDLEAKLSGTPVWSLAGLPAPTATISAFTISLGVPDAMEAAAQNEADRPLLKLKLTGDGDVERVAAVRRAAPAARLIADANEAWDIDQFINVAPALAELGVEMIEQPLPAADDMVLASLEHPVPVCADESCHTSGDVLGVTERYDMVNLKLDKTGGLTEALHFVTAARESGLDLMIGCMMCTSLGIAPATLLGHDTRYNDLDAPLWLAQDREHKLAFEGSIVQPPLPELWG